MLSYDVVDVFTARPYAGNPLAVVHGAAELDPAQLQSIAREFNLSETAFPTARHDTHGTASYDVRIFTPDAEIPFAGHPTLGTAWLLRRQETLTVDDVVQHCGVGPVAVTVSADGAELTATPRFHRERGDADDLAARVGLGPDDVEGVAHEASCGLGWTFLPVRPGAVARSRPPVSGWTPDTKGPDPMGGLAVVSVRHDVDGADGLTVHARVYCPEVGVIEDPGTGSAAAALGPVLAAVGSAGEGTTTYTINQGGEIGRPSVLHGRVDVADGTVRRVRVAGGVVQVGSGSIAIPPL